MYNIPTMFIPSMESLRLKKLLPLSLSTALLIIFQSLISGLPRILVVLSETALSLYFRFCGMSPCTIDLEDHTTMHFWTTNHRQFNKPTLVLIHGFGGHARQQFFRQVWPLSRQFNLYMPDLLFFGKSYTTLPDRSDVIQAKCVGEGLKKLGVERYSVVGLSYGGFVTYRMAEMFGEEVEKIVMISSGICYEEDQKIGHLRKIGRNPVEFLLLEKPDDVRFLIDLSVYKYHPLKWVPDLFLREFINLHCVDSRKERVELIENLLARKADQNLPTLTQETLLIWGDQDNMFPLDCAYQLQRHLGPKSKLEIIKNTGHAVNLDSPDRMNDLILSFLLGCSK